jgi:hypothetical protein
MAHGGGADEVHGLLKRHGIPLEHFKAVASDIHLITKIHVQKRREIREKQGATRELSPEHRAALCDRLRKATLFSFLLFFYVMAGGFIYSAVELPVEMDAAREFDETVAQLEVAAKLQDEGKFGQLEQAAEQMALAENQTNFNDDTGVLDPDSMSERMELVLEYAEDKSAAPSTEDGTYSWSRPSACFFALTIVTTIGYGSFAPATQFGKLFTIPYGTGGLILGGYTLSLVGSVITLGVELVIFKCFRKTVPDQVHLLASFAFFMMYMLTWALVFDLLKEDEDWDYVEALYYCFITLTTIGFGDYVPDERWLPVTAAFIFFGLGVVTSFIGNFVDVILRDLGEDDDLDDAAILDEIINELSNLKELDDKQQVATAVEVAGAQQ